MVGQLSHPAPLSTRATLRHSATFRDNVRRTARRTEGLRELAACVQYRGVEDVRVTLGGTVAACPSRKPKSASIMKLIVEFQAARKFCAVLIRSRSTRIRRSLAVAAQQQRQSERE